MKFLDKNKLYIIKSQDGIYTFEYNSDIIFDFSVYKNKAPIPYRNNVINNLPRKSCT